MYPILVYKRREVCLVIGLVLPKSHIRALREFGLRNNRKLERWEGLDYYLCDCDMRDLELWELDQVLAGARERAPKVRVSGGYFYLKAED